MSEFYPRGDNPADVPELRALLRTGRLSKFRVLDVACKNQHRVLEVLTAGPAGRLIIGWQAIPDSVIRPSDDDLDGPPGATFRKTYISWPLDHLADGAQFSLNCECSGHSVSREWVDAQVAAGRRRAVLPG